MNRSATPSEVPRWKPPRVRVDLDRRLLTWNNTHLLEGELVEAVRALKKGEGPGITVLGSGDVAAQLGEAGLVDEYQFVIIPLALGGGRTVFTGHRELRLVDHRVFRCGNVVVTYAT